MSGGFAGIIVTNSYNKRLQPVFISAAKPTQTVLSLGYDLGLGVNNNGNVYTVTNNRDSARSVTYTYDPLNRLLTAETVSPDLNNSTYRYDAENRMSTTAGVSYTYDGDGVRVKKTGTDAALYWASSFISGPLAESDLAGTISKEFVYFGGDRTARRDASTGAVHYFFSDHLGSANVVTSATGTIEEESDFYPFGGERVIVNSLADQDYKFTSEERDPESGCDYFGARHYCSTLGRFVQADEFAGGPVSAYSSNDPLPPGPLPYADITNPQSLNKYSYTWNNPTNMVDPNGHCPMCVGAILGAGAGAGVILYKTLLTNEPIPTNREIAKTIVAGAILGASLGHAAAKDDPSPQQESEPANTRQAESEHGSSGPTEAYDREKHYGKTPTGEDRKAVGGESADHDPPLVQRYYEGDPSKGEKPGYQQTPEERRSSAQDRDRMNPSTVDAQRSQGGKMSQYSKQKKKEHGFDKKED